MQLLAFDKSYRPLSRVRAFFSGLVYARPFVEIAFRGLHVPDISPALRFRYVDRLSRSVSAAERVCTLLLDNKITDPEERAKLEQSIGESGNPTVISRLLLESNPSKPLDLIFSFSISCVMPFDHFPYLLPGDLHLKYVCGELTESEVKIAYLSRLSKNAFEILLKYDCGEHEGGILYIFSRAGNVEDARSLLSSSLISDLTKRFLLEYIRDRLATN
ncbi:MAG: hypothetical protein Q7S22_02855 [Candidatus Micrarchaeota archaeon]|nr:hypothetical protein [Candidatus Micrarchaeota archaeon]